MVDPRAVVSVTVWTLSPFVSRRYVWRAGNACSAERTQVQLPQFRAVREESSCRESVAPPPAPVWLRCYKASCVGLAATVFVHREHRSLQERRTADQSDGREARETKETRQSFQNKDTQQCQNPGEGRQFVYYMSTS